MSPLSSPYHEDSMKRLWLIVLVVWSIFPYESLAQGWSDVVDPAPGPPRSVGTYTAGCVQGAVALPPEGPGFQTMRRYRRRFFGHPTLIRYLQELAETTTKQRLGILSMTLSVRVGAAYFLRISSHASGKGTLTPVRGGGLRASSVNHQVRSAPHPSPDGRGSCP